MRLAVLFLIGSLSLACGHDPGLSTVTVKTLPGRLAAEATFARADIEALVPLDVNHDGKVSAQEWQRADPSWNRCCGIRSSSGGTAAPPA